MIKFFRNRKEAKKRSLRNFVTQSFFCTLSILRYLTTVVALCGTLTKSCFLPLKKEKKKTGSLSVQKKLKTAHRKILLMMIVYNSALFGLSLKKSAVVGTLYICCIFGT